VLQGAVR